MRAEGKKADVAVHGAEVVFAQQLDLSYSRQSIYK